MEMTNKESGWKVIGHIAVDLGQLLITDPGTLIGKWKGQQTYEDISNQDFGQALGWAVKTPTGGDGEYIVEGYFNKEGYLEKIEINFIQKENFNLTIYSLLDVYNRMIQALEKDPDIEYIDDNYTLMEVDSIINTIITCLTADMEEDVSDFEFELINDVIQASVHTPLGIDEGTKILSNWYDIDHEELRIQIDELLG